MVISKSKINNYLTEVSNGTLSLEADATSEKGGNGQGFRPHDILCAALAACMNINTRMVMDKLGVKYDDVEIKVELDRQEKTTNFVYNIDIKGDIDENKKQEIIKLAENCAVRKTLSKELKFTRK